MPSLKRARRVSPKPPSIASDLESSDFDSSESSEAEVTLNILERQPRITAGKRTKVVTGEEAQTDSVFWGSDQHRTWEESESDSEVSYDLDEEESESSVDLDEEESEESSEEEVEVEVSMKKRNFKAYVDPREKSEVKKVRKTIVRKKSLNVETKEVERVGTRDTTRARTEEVSVRADKTANTPKTPRKEQVYVPLTHAELMDEARITEEWNTADLQAYIKYTELSDKERAANFAFSKKVPKYVYRSFKDENNEERSEIRMTIPLTISSTSMVVPKKTNAKYRYPYMEDRYFNTCEEFSRIHEEYLELEKAEIKSIIADLTNRLA